MHLPTEQFPALTKHAKIIASLFGSTYVCEQLFSKMNFVKCKTRTQLTDGQFDDALKSAARCGALGGAATAQIVILDKMVLAECQEDGP